MASKVVFTLVVLTTYIHLSYAKSVSTVSIGGMTIFTDGNVLRCDSLTCPETGERCVITMKTNDKDNTKLVTWKRCLDKDSNVVLEDKFTTQNKNPYDHFNIHIEGGRDGNVSSLNSSEAQKLADEILKDVAESLRGIFDNW